MNNYRVDFPEFPSGAYPALPPTFRDSSWHNDGQPSMTSETLRLHIWVDHPDSPYSPVDDGPRFGVTPLDEDGALAQDEPALTTNEWRDVLEYVYEAWLKTQGLDGEAMELLMGADLTAEQRQWLSDFVVRWQAMEEQETP